MNELQEGDLVLCTVTQIVKTTVFVKLEDGRDGAIVISEIAPGRIRNIRDYVAVGRKIVCKILRIDGNSVNLSLRRVSLKERNEVLEGQQKERNALSILRTVLLEKAEEVASKIKQTSGLNEFLQNCKTSPSELEKYMKKPEAARVCEILQEKKDKRVEAKKEFFIASKASDGIKTIKSILSTCKGNCEINYLGSGKFMIKIIAQEYKEANSNINKSLQEIELQAKKNKLEFNIK
jgi:translation initiation factor 2 alpha subunit (eIF-2alpha)